MASPSKGDKVPISLTKVHGHYTRENPTIGTVPSCRGFEEKSKGRINKKEMEEASVFLT